jgi:hypothetical protein
VGVAPPSADDDDGADNAAGLLSLAPDEEATEADDSDVPRHLFDWDDETADRNKLEDDGELRDVGGRLNASENDDVTIKTTNFDNKFMFFLPWMDRSLPNSHVGQWLDVPKSVAAFAFQAGR